MSVNIEILIPQKTEDLYVGDSLDRKIFEAEAKIFSIAFLNAGLLDEKDVDIEYLIEGHPEMPDGEMKVSVKGVTIVIKFERQNSKN